MLYIFFWILLKLFYQAAKWDKAAFHRSRVRRSQKSMRSEAYWRLPYTVSMYRVKKYIYISPNTWHAAIVNGAFERSIKDLFNCIITSPKYTCIQSYLLHFSFIVGSYQAKCEPKVGHSLLWIHLFFGDLIMGFDRSLIDLSNAPLMVAVWHVCWEIYIYEKEEAAMKAKSSHKKPNFLLESAFEFMRTRKRQPKPRNIWRSIK